MNNSRAANTLKNIGVNIISLGITTIFSFISRTIFIYTLGVEYLGVNGLFTNILAVLSFAELGIGNAIIFSMYKPLAEKNNMKLNALMNLYKKAYTMIGVIVLILGLMVIPILDYIIKSPPNISDNIILIYILFLGNVVLSYFVAYKTSIITADQKDYIVIMYRQFFVITQSIIQIIILLVNKNYILYLLIQLVGTLLANLLLSRKANKMYPEVLGKEKIELDSDEKKHIFNNVKALFLYKIGSVILTGTDNILISMCIGIKAVGVSSNYIFITSYITNTINKLLSSITASVGNLNAVESVEKKEQIFNQILFLSTWIYSFVSISMMILINPFIELWIGKEYLLPNHIVFALVSVFYITGSNFAAFTYRTTMGLFEQSKFVPIFAAIFNIILSIVLAKYMGLMGIFLATTVSRFLTFCWTDPYYIYKINFKKSPLNYYLKYIIYMLNTIIIYFITKSIADLIMGDSWRELFYKVIICIIICNSTYVVFYFRTKEFKKIISRLNNIYCKLIRYNS